MATKTDYGVDKQFFIWAWESSDGPDEAHEKLVQYAVERNLPPMPKPVMLARASQYRSEGLELKKHRPGRKGQMAEEVKALNDYIASLRSAVESGKAPKAPKVEKKKVAAPAEVDPDVKKQALKMLEDMIAGKKVKFPTKEST